MSMEIVGTAAGISSGFRRVVDVFLAGEGLPFSQILSAERIERICGAAWLHVRTARDLFDARRALGVPVAGPPRWEGGRLPGGGCQHRCRAARAGRGTAHGRYWRLLPCPGQACAAALKAISCEVAEELERAADPCWLWKGTHHAKLVDGFTFTMPDTPANQRQYPQAKTQQPGIGLPIGRATAIMSLATGAITNLACGRYQGKQTGETALLRSMLDSFQPGDVVVMDRYFCSFMMLAMLHGRGVLACTRLHQRRSSDLRQGRRLGKHDRLMNWTTSQSAPTGWTRQSTRRCRRRSRCG